MSLKKPTEKDVKKKEEEMGAKFFSLSHYTPAEKITALDQVEKIRKERGDFGDDDKP